MNDSFLNTFLVLILLSAFSCSNDTKRNEVNGTLTEEYPDSLFKYFSKKIINESDLNADYDETKREYKLAALNVMQRKILTDSILGVSRAYGAYFYSRQSKVSDIQPILVYTHADDYSSILLLNLSKENKVIDKIGLTSSICDLIDQDAEKETVYCEKKYSEFTNDSTIQVIALNVTTENFGEGKTISTIDSLTKLYRIISTGKIKEIQKDSVRYIKKR